jgi:hypothetical protein
MMDALVGYASPCVCRMQKHGYAENLENGCWTRHGTAYRMPKSKRSNQRLLLTASSTASSFFSYSSPARRWSPISLSRSI